jgi:DMSO/TMAO reductase YedYZ molybdopterin-dependent catalytic subunit
VRYHLSEIPEVKVMEYMIKIDGDGANCSLELTLEELKKKPAVEIAAVNQCSGNRRGLSTPHAVDISTDGGEIWWRAKLGEDLGKCAFRP